MKRRRHRRSWQRVGHAGLGLLIVALAVELVYRLVALPPDYHERATEPMVVVQPIPEPAEPAIESAANPVANPVIEPAAGDRAFTERLPAGRAVTEPLPAGLRVTRKLDPRPERALASLPGAAALVAAARPAATAAVTSMAPAVDTRPEAATASPPEASPTGTAPAATATLVTLPVPPRRPAAGPPSGAPLIAIVVDDMGYNPASLRRLARLPGPLTLAFLPDADATGPMLKTAARGDFELVLHLPMEPMTDDDPGPRALRVGLDADELRQRVRWAIDAVPGAVGVNNHMGSRFTGYAAGLEVVMDEIRRHGLYFLDSRTNPASLAEHVARAAGLPASRRDVFLDHDPDPRAIRRQLTLVERVAERHGTAIAIGHPYPSTLAALEAWLPTAQRRGFRLARLSEVIAERLCREAGRPEPCGAELHLTGGAVGILPQTSAEAAP